MKWLSEHTESLQNRFAEYCRTGQNVTIPGTSGERMKHYRRLSFNAVNSALEQAFPITLEFLSESEWLDLVDGFFANHTSTTPLLWKMPFEFFNYVEDNDLSLKSKYPFLTELIYFEWLEIEVHTMEDIPLPEGTKSKEEPKDTDAIVLNPEHRLVQMQYPLHLTALQAALEKPGTYYVFIYREPESGNVKFLDLSPLYAFAFSLLAEQPLSKKTLINKISEQFQLSQTGKLKKYLDEFMRDMVKQHAVRGYLQK